MNEMRRRALETGEYPCMECGKLMVFEDEKWRDSLVCEHCGWSCSLDDYGEDPAEVENQKISDAVAYYQETHEEIYGDEDDD